MSAFIGEVRTPDHLRPLIFVHASLGGVELTSDPRVSLTPIQARAYALMVVAAADEVDRMRSFPGAPANAYVEAKAEANVRGLKEGESIAEWIRRCVPR